MFKNTFFKQVALSRLQDHRKGDASGAILNSTAPTATRLVKKLSEKLKNARLRRCEKICVFPISWSTFSSTILQLLNNFPLFFHLPWDFKEYTRSTKTEAQGHPRQVWGVAAPRLSQGGSEGGWGGSPPPPMCPKTKGSNFGFGGRSVTQLRKEPYARGRDQRMNKKKQRFLYFGITLCLLFPFSLFSFVTLPVQSV